MEMKNEVLSNKSAQNMDTSRYQVSDLDDVEFCWESIQLEVDAVFSPGMGTPFFPSTFNDFEMGSMDENPILIEKEQGKKNSPHLVHPTTPVSEKLTQPPLLMKNRPLGTRMENVPDDVYRRLFEKFFIVTWYVF